jgi:hypothetical protein
MTPPSLNEVARVVTGAALGLQWPVGIARDVGAAAAWLCGAGVDGVACAMAGLTGARDRPDLGRTGNDGWHMSGATVLVLPSALDLALGDDVAVTVAAPDNPLLAYGLCGWAAQQTGRLLDLKGAVTARIHGGAISGPPGLEPGADLILRAGPQATVGSPAQISRAFPDPAAWATARRAAAQMLVPTSATSRARGAGPVGIDAD